MRVTIDGAGRLVVPKAARERLGLTAGSELELRVTDQRLEFEVPALPMTLVEHEHGVSARVEPGQQMPVLTSEMVRETLDNSRR
jgi:AbrB family looped-hinge helix DNA binding protein